MVVQTEQYQNCTFQGIHTFFYKNTINFSEPQIFLNSKQLFDDFPAIPTPNYMLKMLLLICPFRLRTLFPQKTNISHFFEKSSTKSQPRYSYKLDSYKKKRVYAIIIIIQRPYFIHVQSLRRLREIGQIFTNLCVHIL